jgi:hypothetical protein
MTKSSQKTALIKKIAFSTAAAPLLRGAQQKMSGVFRHNTV